MGGEVDLPTCQALPIDRLWCPPRFILYQHTMMGMAEYVPMQIRNSDAYCTEMLSCTLSRIAKPVIDKQMGPRVNKKRCLVQSETVATIMAKPKATAQGGTERSWVWMASYL